MSDAYRLGIQGIMDQNTALLTDDIRAIFLRGYTLSQAHEFFDDLGGLAVGDNDATGFGAGATLAGVTTAGGSGSVPGTFDANDRLLTNISGAALSQLCLYKHDGVAEATSRLIGFIDGFSVTPNGGDITINWSNGVSGILRLTKL